MGSHRDFSGEQLLHDYAIGANGYLLQVKPELFVVFAKVQGLFLATFAVAPREGCVD